MAESSVRRSPRDTTPKTDQKIEEWAARGSSEPERKNDDDLHMTSIRVPVGVLKRIDRLRKSRMARVSRNVWILEAIEDKLGREEEK